MPKSLGSPQCGSPDSNEHAILRSSITRRQPLIRSGDVVGDAWAGRLKNFGPGGFGREAYQAIEGPGVCMGFLSLVANQHPVGFASPRSRLVCDNWL